MKSGEKAKGWPDGGGVQMNTTVVDEAMRDVKTGDDARDNTRDEARVKWLSVRCGLSATQLNRFAMSLSVVPGYDPLVEFVAECARVLADVDRDSVDPHRLSAIEYNAAMEIERLRARANVGAQIILGNMVVDMDEQTVDGFVAKTMNNLGCTGFDSGRAGRSNAGVNRRGRRNVGRNAGKKTGVKTGGKTAGGTVDSLDSLYSLDDVAARHIAGNTGPKVDRTGGKLAPLASSGRVVAARGEPVVKPVSVKQGAVGTAKTTAQRDARYAMVFESWCGVRLRLMGFKMKNIAKALSMDAPTLWRHISGYTRYWKAMQLEGRLPEIKPEWEERLQVVLAEMTTGGGVRGRPVKPRDSATRDVGLGPGVEPPV